MSLHFQRQLDKIKKAILALGALVEESVHHSLQALRDRDPELARKVIEQDNVIDEKEIDLEEECLHTMALYQPVAFDLRYVVSVQKINNDLERIGDLAVNIAEQALFLAHEPNVKRFPKELDEMATMVTGMIKDALDALVNTDSALAETVRHRDADVDMLHRKMYVRVKEAIRDNIDEIDQLFNLMNVSKQLERMGDHAVNVAEDVIYMSKGEIKRHAGLDEADLKAAQAKQR